MLYYILFYCFLVKKKEEDEDGNGEREIVIWLDS